MSDFSDLVALAARSIQRQFPQQVDGMIILGTGLSDLPLDGFSVVGEIPYSKISAMPNSTAPGHKGELLLVNNGKKTLALCAGRHHLYEGYTAQQVAMLVYTINQLGAKELVITNAAGALNEQFRPGDIMLIDDHINATGHNPLVGQDDVLGSRFPDMSKAYDPKFIDRAMEISKRHDLNCQQGIYVGVLGPSLETSPERRMYRAMGADAIGMSTVTEVIAANHCDMRVLGISAITNLATGDLNQQPDTIEDVLKNAAIAGQGIRKVLHGLYKEN